VCLIPYVLIPVSVFIVSFWNVNWWSLDDTQILKHAVSNSLWDLFFSPEVWRELSASNLTPWVSVVFKLDHALFGLNPDLFYLHHLTSLSIALVLLYQVSLNLMDRKWAVTAVFIFMMTRPLLMAMQVLMLRHYVEGLLFALAGCLCFLGAVRRKKLVLSVAAAVFYLLASSAKEIYVPLPCLLLFFPVADYRSRIKALGFMLACIPVYVVWRSFMLGNLVGGYGHVLSLADVSGLFNRVFDAAGFQGIFPMAVILISLLYFLFSGFRRFLFTSAAVVSVMVPIIPVSSMMAPRYVLVPALFAVVCLCGALSGIHAKTEKKILRFSLVALPLFLCGMLYISNFVNWMPDMRKRLARAKVEGEYVLMQGNRGEMIYQPESSDWFYQGLGWFRSELLCRDKGPGTFRDFSALLQKENLRILRYSSESMAVEDMDRAEEMIASHYKALRNNAPLYVKMDYKNPPVISWEFGPWETGEYAVIFVDEYQIVQAMPRSGRLPVQIRDKRTLVVRYVSEDGWRTYSPFFVLEAETENNSIEWERKK
jgi:hypothetical protein